MESPFMRESLLQERTNGKVRCHVCERRCTIGAGGAGWCRTRQNHDGRLVTLIYGSASSIAVNPIEKKPFYHFYPGTLTLTAGSWSCNFGCPWCQNWDISKTLPPRAGAFVSPEQFVELTEQHGCQGTSISFNEPTLSLEWSLDVFRLARGRGLYNTYVTNGYYPAYKFTAPPTPIRTLERAWHIGKDAGLEFVYVGNVPGHRYDDTVCPTCNTLLIRRMGFDVTQNVLRDGQCPKCGRAIAGVWSEK